MSGRRWVGRAVAVWTLGALVVVLITTEVLAGPASAAGPAPSPPTSAVPGGPSAIGEVPAAV
ncbi:hypothetical protein [Quadrisphaera setariae]|uniref:Uncharacterized protein n=1 Tax=Quadrisphaera setariae TaxID=2593304 RepID=A0A5C8ZGW5_9ACTN|nr:hypothetical protein [Quadrisphaera setariae]TXR57285.1 hypothetical protein FMM08_03135 [Quadrisphaera setariae]